MRTTYRLQRHNNFGKILLLAVPLVLVGCNPGGFSANSWNAPKRLVQIDGYRDWTLVTKTPQDMSPSMAALCVGPDSAHLGDNPHLPKVFRVFVNPVGAGAMMAKDPKDFPDGSIIVKEKFNREDFPQLKSPDQNMIEKKKLNIQDQKPVLMTVMIKKEGKWDYFITNADGSIQKIDKDKCTKCHQQVKEHDYVFKPYVAPYPALPRSQSR
jgi:hypothetical protein